MNDQNRTILIAIAAAVLGFGLGAVWQYSAGRGPARDLEQTTQDLAFQQLEATLGAATIEAQRGSHEIARQLASDFFSGLQTHIGSAPAGQRQEFEQLLQQRDAMITSLSRGDPQAGNMLAQMFIRYRIAMGEPVGPAAGTQSPEPPAQQPQQPEPEPEPEN
jgi:hypothetical protein